MQIPPHIFRAYDIRGIARGGSPELTPDFARGLGAAYAFFVAREIGGARPRLVVGHDNRLTGEALSSAFIAGALAAGADVTDIGHATSPYLYFAVCHGGFDGGVAITGSHNPPEYNGFKMTRAAAQPIAGEDIQEIREIMEVGVATSDEAGMCQSADFTKDYFKKITELAPSKRRLKIVTDCGNGTAGYFAPQLLTDLGYELIELYSEPDGNFPNHMPDPEHVETLRDLQAKVIETGADLGLAWDGDADRVGLVDEQGNVIPADRLLVLLARDLLSRHAGAEIIFDVKCSNVLAAEIEKAGGKATRYKTGHSFIKQKMRETGALLAGEVSGHIFFGENYYGVDDGILAAAKLASIVSQSDKKVSALLTDIPPTHATPELKLPVSDAVKFEVMDAIATDFEKDFMCDRLDGIRWDYPSTCSARSGQAPEDIPRTTQDDSWGWGLIRASNTSPYLTARFEASSAERLAEIVADVAARLKQYDALDASALSA